ncbi:hypothetical protein AVEN_234867-1 [Araneus ventricosus]|uniref:Uncharacterized protein n=1 Tax=Araneus ventricosus TaxID=182803 RepID=A0A4Y2IHA5_ARAVE|nr:hypothetical protein AVEN_234867-1 [Araneus ventricosus]
MRDGQCCNSFPKQFKDDTEENVNGYPIYRRKATEPVQTGPHYAFANIEELLTSYNLSLQKLHLPTVDLPASVLERANFDVVEEEAKANSYTMQ